MIAYWIIMALCALAGGITIWLFAAGWAGRIEFLPSIDLLSNGEWPLFTVFVVLMYGPLIVTLYCLYRALAEWRNVAKDKNAQD